MQRGFLSTTKQWFGKILIGLALCAALSLAGFAIVTKDLPDPKQFENRKINQSTKIYDRTGEILLYEIHGEEKRTVISFEAIPEHIKQATIAIEDANFFTH